MKVLAVNTHRFQTASSVFCHLASEMAMTDVARVSRSSKAGQVNNNVYFYIKRSSCVLSHLNKQLFLQG